MLPRKGEKYYPDLKVSNGSMLNWCGIKSESISVVDICTMRTQCFGHIGEMENDAASRAL